MARFGYRGGGAIAEQAHLFTAEERRSSGSRKLR
jgi:hypothetical protein